MAWDTFLRLRTVLQCIVNLVDIQKVLSGELPSGYVKIAIENGHRNSGFSHWKWWFSIAMLVYQRVTYFGPSLLRPASASQKISWSIPTGPEKDLKPIILSHSPLFPTILSNPANLKPFFFPTPQKKQKTPHHWVWRHRVQGAFSILKVPWEAVLKAGLGRWKGAQSNAMGYQPPSPAGIAPLLQKRFLDFGSWSLEPPLEWITRPGKLT